MLTTGSVIFNKYEILSVIGKGGMSTVYLARDVKLHKQWTIKEILKSGSSKKNKVNIDSLLEEANLIKKLDHPYIPRIVDIIETENTLFIVRDYIDGEPMDQVIKNFGSQPEASVIAWGKQLCDVLGYLHNRTPRIIYRDMKPANIMLVSDGSIRLIDFGIAIEEGSNSPTSKRCIGTKGYAPEEQSKSVKATDERSDIYALGMTLCQMATGISPMTAGFNKKTVVEEHLGGYSSQFRSIIEKCIADNPDDRFQNCSELLYALNKAEHSDAGKEKKDSGGLKKILPVLFIVLFIITFIFSLILGNIDFGLGSLAEGLFGLKNISFIISVALLILGFKVNEMLSGDKAGHAKQITGSADSFVVAEAKKGSFSDVIYHGIGNEVGQEFESVDGAQALSELLDHVGVNDNTGGDNGTDGYQDEEETGREFPVAGYAGDGDENLDTPLEDVPFRNEPVAPAAATAVSQATDLFDDKEPDPGTEVFDDKPAGERGTEIFEEDDEDDDSFTTLLTADSGKSGVSAAEKTAAPVVTEKEDNEDLFAAFLAENGRNAVKADEGGDEDKGTDVLSDDGDEPEEGGTELFEEDDEDDDSFTTLLTADSQPAGPALTENNPEPVVSEQGNGDDDLFADFIKENGMKEIPVPVQEDEEWPENEETGTDFLSDDDEPEEGGTELFEEIDEEEDDSFTTLLTVDTQPEAPEVQEDFVSETEVESEDTYSDAFAEEDSDDEIDFSETGTDFLSDEDEPEEGGTELFEEYDEEETVSGLSGDYAPGPETAAEENPDGSDYGDEGTVVLSGDSEEDNPGETELFGQDYEDDMSFTTVLTASQKETIGISGQRKAETDGPAVIVYNEIEIHSEEIFPVDMP